MHWRSLQASVQYALHIVLDHAHPKPLNLQPIMTAPDPLSPYPASTKDGNAVVAADDPGPVPSGADAVPTVEHTTRVLDDEDDDNQNMKKVVISKEVVKGQDIRPVGIDIGLSDTVLKAEERLGPAEIGLLATIGLMNVKIRDSNRAMLLAAVTLHECEAVDLGISNDEEGELEKSFDKAISCDADVIITFGGVSMGGKDYVKPVLERRGTYNLFWKGAHETWPLTFATIDDSAKQPKR